MRFVPEPQEEPRASIFYVAEDARQNIGFAACGWHLGVPLHALTAAVPAARIHDGKHVFSDAVWEGIMGIIAAGR